MTRAIAEQLIAGLTGLHLRAITALPDLPDPSRSPVLAGHTSGVRALMVAPDGSWLASAGYGGEIRVWDPATGTTRHTLTGHTSAVRALAVAPDGSWLASAGDSGEIRIWDPLTGTARHTLTGHTDWTLALGIAPMGPGWPPGAMAGRFGFGIRPLAPPATPSPATPARCARWQWPRMGPG
jgi:WD40 repeat protein